jgi:hypothetical protein
MKRSIGHWRASALNGAATKWGAGLGAASPSGSGSHDDVRRKTQDLVRVNKTNSLGTAFAQESCLKYAPNAQLWGAK